MPDEPITQRSRHPLSGVAHAPGVPKPDPILSGERIKRQFGGLVAVDVDQFQVQRGAITALIGPNGAGKTTLFNVLSGFDRGGSGSWRFNEQDLSGARPYRIAKLGMVRTFQLTKALSRMTVLDNMRLAASGQRGESFWTALLPPLWRAQEAAITKQADELLVRFNLHGMREEFAGSLSGGQRKLLEMARALMTRPELVLLDEPMAGVNPALKQSLLEHIKTLRTEGLTVLFVEHDMDMVRDISDWVIVMGQGRIIAEGPAASAMRDPVVIDAYLGAHHDQPLAPGPATGGPR